GQLLGGADPGQAVDHAGRGLLAAAGGPDVAGGADRRGGALAGGLRPAHAVHDGAPGGRGGGCRPGGGAGGGGPAAALGPCGPVGPQHGDAGGGLLPELLRPGLLPAALVEDGGPAAAAPLQPVRGPGGRLLGLRADGALAPADGPDRAGRPGDGLGDRAGSEPVGAAAPVEGPTAAAALRVTPKRRGGEDPCEPHGCSCWA